MLYQGRDGLSYLGELEGDAKTVGDGLEGLLFPAVNAEGTHAVMLRQDEKKRSWPVVVELATGKQFPIKVDPGRWVGPVWR